MSALEEDEWSDGFPEDVTSLELHSDQVIQEEQEGRPFTSALPQTGKLGTQARENQVRAMQILNEFKSRPILVQSGNFQDDPVTEEALGIQTNDTTVRQGE